MKKLSLIVLISLLVQGLSAQQIYTPRNYKKALKNKTRNLSGKPGSNYWQNKSSYKIITRVNPQTAILDGKETITYVNNSPDSLRYITLHNFQNLYKKGTIRSSRVNPKDINEGVILNNIKVNKKTIDNKKIIDKGTLLYLLLPSKIAPKQTMTITIDWSFKIPEKSNIRMGKYTEKSLFIAQWFPKIAVYDDMDKWDRHAHNGLAEFYGEYSDYEVFIEVPENYIVRATGDVQNAEEILKAPIFKLMQKAQQSEKNILIASAKDGNITKTGNQTWHFKANNVIDFAFGLAKDYIWEGSSVKPKGLEKRIFVDALYNPMAKDFKEVVSFAKQTLKYMSEEMPAIPYPFSHMTVFNGDGGMEYPMIVNNGSNKKRRDAVYVTSHEIFHSIFPMYVSISETKYGWFDEGFTVLFPEQLQDRIEPSVIQAKKQTYFQERSYLGSEREPLLMTPSYCLDGLMYFSLNYGKSEIALRMFMDYLGKDKFKNLMKSFIETWAGKHPTPYDFFNFCSSYSNENLSWYWTKWFYEYAKPDLAISFSKQDNDSKVGDLLTIENIGGLPLPIDLKLEYKDGKIIHINRKLNIWENSKKTVVIDIPNSKDLKIITLGDELTPDIERKDNVIIL